MKTVLSCSEIKLATQVLYFDESPSHLYPMSVLSESNKTCFVSVLVPDSCSSNIEDVRCKMSLWNLR